MSNSISIDTYKVDIIADTSYRTWLDFYLNIDEMDEQTNRAIFTDTAGKSLSISLPFNEAILQKLVTEEFNMILEHLSCKDFEEFEKLTDNVEGPDTKKISVIVRAVDGSVYFRQYAFNPVAYVKLKRLYATPLKYRTWHERSRP